MSSSKKLKINLLTFHRALSYGAVLQTYALIKSLEDKGHRVEIIDFQKPFLLKMPTGWWSFKKTFGYDRLRQEFTFYSFRKKYYKSLTKPLKTIKSVKEYQFNADAFIVGSDQVWNPRITKDSFKIYFFDSFKGKKISYAASFGNDNLTLTEQEMKEVRDLLKDFSSISVREESGKKIINKIFELEATTVLDPTLIWRDYSELLEPVNYSDYIFCFKVNHSEDFITKAIEIGEKLNKKVLLVGEAYENVNVVSIPNPSVEQWISLLKNSSFVFTDSFHGLAFSLNFKKEFLIFNTNPSRFSRISNLLESVDLNNRIYNSDADLLNILNIKINDIAYEKLNYLKKESISFLNKALLT